MRARARFRRRQHRLAPGRDTTGTRDGRRAGRTGRGLTAGGPRPAARKTPCRPGDALPAKLDGIDPAQARPTLAAFDAAVDPHAPFDPSVGDRKGTRGLPLPKSNRAQAPDAPPSKASAVTGGITFT
ncbi:hypothetical protein OPKNFCMD_3102 [Methylobacterium crusticola]|uniref:Uncharacterized protein n=1 Tax=Methylobacterium crusticola TaxID=1697972 RepID=A0ABQ4QY93_9HYPH|nr:hypothetical protein [Methylobacterium crusticola]GJD50363.1 hypothetical protein OPKNFCMD_3102 [Methylobacterium crusticola]